MPFVFHTLVYSCLSRLKAFPLYHDRGGLELTDVHYHITVQSASRGIHRYLLSVRPVLCAPIMINNVHYSLKIHLRVNDSLQADK